MVSSRFATVMVQSSEDLLAVAKYNQNLNNISLPVRVFVKTIELDEFFNTSLQSIIEANENSPGTCTSIVFSGNSRNLVQEMEKVDEILSQSYRMEHSYNFVVDIFAYHSCNTGAATIINQTQMADMYIITLDLHNIREMKDYGFEKVTRIFRDCNLLVKKLNEKASLGIRLYYRDFIEWDVEKNYDSLIWVWYNMAKIAKSENVTVFIADALDGRAQSYSSFKTSGWWTYDLQEKIYSEKGLKTSNLFVRSSEGKKMMIIGKASDQGIDWGTVNWAMLSVICLQFVIILVLIVRNRNTRKRQLSYVAS